jgi:hypothetical protein
MSFLAPLFLAGLAALAVPVVIHLIQRERKQVVVFPSLMFVRRIPYQSVRRRRIRHWTLLLVRLAALALIVAAFARPFLPQTGAAAAAGGAREVVVLLDGSYSMGYGDRWDRARAAARDAIAALGPADRGTLVLFSSGAEVRLRSTSDRQRLLAAVPSDAPGAGATRYAPALQAAGSILADSSLPRREAILISDFQRVAWRGAEGGRLPDGAVLTPVVIGGDAGRPNLAMSALSMSRSAFAGQERVTITAGVLNRGAAKASPAVTLDLDGRAVQTQQASVEPGGSASVTFAPVTVGSQPMRATVTLPGDALARDNVWHFVISPAVPVRVLLVDRDGAAGRSSLYVSRALSIGDDPRIDLVHRGANAVGDDELRRASVVLLNDVAVTRALADRLRRFVEAGGGLFAALGPRAAWPDGNGSLLPVVPGDTVDRTRGDAARIGGLEYGHPVFEPFRAPRSGDFSAVRFFAYRGAATRDVQRTSGAPEAQVLARFDTGAPALVERTAGRGRVLAWMSALDTTWGDFPLKPVFLPFLHRAVRHLAGYAPPAPWMTVGQAVEAGSPAGAGGGSTRVALTPSGRSVALDDEGADILELEEQGFYEIRSQAPGARAELIASNVDVAESDLTMVDPAELAAAAMGRAGADAGGAAAGPISPEAQERAQRVWWYLLAAGLLLLSAETVLAARLSRTP